MNGRPSPAEFVAVWALVLVASLAIWAVAILAVSRVVRHLVAS